MYGLADSNFQLLVPATSENIFQCNYKYGSIIIKEEGKNYIFNLGTNEKKLLDFEVVDNKSNLIRGAKTTFTWGLVDFNGKIVLPFQYRYINISDDEEYAIVKEDKKNRVSFIGTGSFKEKEGISDQIERKNSRSSSSRVIQLKPVIKNIGKSWDNINLYKNGYAIVELNSKFGLIDSSGNIVAPATYDEILYTDFGYFKTTLKKLKGLIAPNKDLYISPKYIDIVPFYPNTSFFEFYGTYDQIGLLNPKNNKTIPSIYSNIKYAYIDAKWTFICSQKNENIDYYDINFNKILQ
jgi:hypothetical protein